MGWAAVNGPGHSSFVFGFGNQEALAAEHHVELGYTNRDDGIWLSCACGWEHLLDFRATPERAMELTAQHRQGSPDD